MEFSSPVIAIDGPAASGKGTIARRLAEAYQFAHLDTGLLYRAAGLLALEHGSHGEAAINVLVATETFIDRVLGKMADPLLREDATAQMASKVAALPEVRQALLKFQHNFCQNPPLGAAGAVLDGRDIGTVIAPKAEVKIYVTASLAARAERRWKELQRRALHQNIRTATEAAVFKDMEERDARDASRSAAPAKPAPDAVILDTTSMTADEAYLAALTIAEGVLPKPI